MFFIVQKEKSKTYKVITKDLEQIINHLNELLTIFADDIISSCFGPSNEAVDFIHKGRLIITWSLSDDAFIGFGNMRNSDMYSIEPNINEEDMVNIRTSLYGLEDMDVYKLLLPYYTVYSSEFLGIYEKVKILKPEILLDLIHAKLFTNPYVFFVDLFGYDKVSFYQAFILYLNKTIVRSEDGILDSYVLSLNNIMKPFSGNGSIEPFQKLFFIFLQKKNLNIFEIRNIVYKPALSF
jgi:hypothetical protein